MIAIASTAANVSDVANTANAANAASPSNPGKPAPAILPDLVHCVRTAFREHGETAQVGTRVAEAIRPFLGHPRLLAPEQCEPDPTRYRQHVLHAEEDGSFSIVALVWMPGQATCVHDHLAWCVIGVHQGSEQEVQFELVEAADGAFPFLRPLDSSINPTGSVVVLTPPGDIHYVVNPGPGTAISIHVYGLDVRQHGSSIRRRYDLPVHQPDPPSLPDLPERPGQPAERERQAPGLGA